MLKRIFSINLILIVFFSINANSQQDEITVDELQGHVRFLASDSLKGRKPGTQGGYIAAEYIKTSLIDHGVELAADDGFQYFDVVTGVELGNNN